MRARAPLVLALVLALAPALAGCISPAQHPHADEEGAPSHAAPSAPATSTAPASPYAGQQTREIKSLSAEEVEGYRKGAGLGYAKPAELNSYPGPLHALEMAEVLELTDDQHAAITQLRADMLARAVPLGEEYLLIESQIEQGFRDGTLDDATLRALLQRSGDIESELRFVHLEAHLATRELLTRHQVALYDEARGYSSGGGHDGAHGHE